MALVLVTGGTGFVATHCLIRLLAAGHETRATVRDRARESDLRTVLCEGEPATWASISPCSALI
jgi:uncharacterized protein YbjT (DUF2867 family)